MTFTLGTYPAVPPLPGTVWMLSTLSLWASFQARVCSRPPLPTSNMRRRSDDMLRLRLRCLHAVNFSRQALNISISTRNEFSRLPNCISARAQPRLAPPFRAADDEMGRASVEETWTRGRHIARWRQLSALKTSHPLQRFSATDVENSMPSTTKLGKAHSPASF